MDARVSFVTAPMKRSGINPLPFPDPDGRNTEYTPGSSVEVAPQKYSVSPETDKESICPKPSSIVS